LAGGQGGASDGGGDNSGGGGGGGYFGGGGGGSDAEYGCGGGGGSSFGVTGLTNEVNTSAAASVTITYTLPKAGTSTSVSCAPNPVVVGQATQCTATVSDTSSTPSTPTGSVSFGSNSSGSFGSGGSCTLSGSGAQVSCAVSYTPAAVGTGAHMIAASYAGDGGHVGSNNSTNVAVTAPNASLKITYFAAAADRHGDAAAAATFTDTNPPAKVSQYTGTIYWGDNSSPTAASFVRLGQHGFAAAGVHHYAKPGAYTVMITINGIGGASAQKTTKVTVPRN
jgi:hypothetical protein